MLSKSSPLLCLETSLNVHILHSLSLLNEIHEASTTRLAPLADGNCVPDPTCSTGSHLDETFTCIPDNCQPGFKYENGQCEPANNQSPIANAGPDQTVESEDSVTLDVPVVQIQTAMR